MSEGTFRQTLRAAWHKANQPLPGTSPRPTRTDWVYVEGRIPFPLRPTASNKTKAIFILVATLLTALLALGLRLLDPVLRNAVESNLCVEDWFGKSLGLLIALTPLWLMMLLMSGLCVYIFVAGYRIWCRRRTVPEGKKPLFRQRLIEGAAAVRLGQKNMALGAALVALCIYCFYLLFHLTSMLWVPVSAIKRCQAPQQHQTIPSIQENSP